MNCRFDIFDFKKEQESVKRDLLSKLVRPHLEVTAKTVEKEFSKLQSGKAMGPDKISGRIL